MIEDYARYLPHAEVVATELDGETGREAVLLHLGTRRYFSLNRTGLRIWNWLSEGHTPSQITDDLVKTYGIGLEHARRSTLTLLEGLAEQQLICAQS